jgi:DNA-binding NarL/FixJ family response regulator
MDGKLIGKAQHMQNGHPGQHDAAQAPGASLGQGALIVEDHPLYRNALASLLAPLVPSDGAHGVEAIRSAASAEEGLRMAASSAPRVILLDPGLPRMNGVEAVAAFARACPRALIIAVSASDDRREVAAALRAGALAFVSKAVAPEVLTGVIAEALAGQPPQARWITPEGSGEIEGESTSGLSPRQREVLTLLCQGHSNKEISLRLALAEITVKMHVSLIFRALQVASRTQAVLAARRLGLYAEEL